MNFNKRIFVSSILTIMVLFWLSSSALANSVSQDTVSTKTYVSENANLSFGFNMIDYVSKTSGKTETRDPQYQKLSACLRDDSAKSLNDSGCLKAGYKFVSSVNSIVNFVLIILFIFAFFKFVWKLFGWEGWGWGGSPFGGSPFWWGGGWDSWFSFSSLLKKAGWELLVIVVLFWIWFWIFADIKNITAYIMDAISSSVELQSEAK